MTQRKSIDDKSVPVLAHNETTLYPAPGDVIFCSGNKLIEIGQTAFVRQHKSITHVALVVSSVEIAEGMVGEAVQLQESSQWLAARRAANPKESYRILRAGRSAGLSLEIQRSVTFYLDETYGIHRTLNWKEPGRSICTTFVAKTLLQAGLLPDVLPSLRVMFPGNFFRLLKEYDFREIPATFFFEGLARTSGQPSADRLAELLYIFDGLQTEIGETQGKFVGWLSIVKEDFDKDPWGLLMYWEDIIKCDIVTYSERLAEVCRVLLDSIRLLQHRGPQNWQHGSTHQANSIELLRKLASEHFHLIKLISEAHSEKWGFQIVRPIAKSPDAKIYANIAEYLSAVELGARTMRAILGLI